MTNNDQYEHDHKDLVLEYDGICNTIKSYTNDGNINNYLIKLGNAIQTNDLYAIKYCLKEIKNWYTINISAIHSNMFCNNIESHDENLKKINQFVDAFSNYADDDNFNKEKIQIDSSPLIFLSHSISDKKYADALEKFIIGLGVKNEQLIYTSHPMHQIPLDNNIYDYLRKHIDNTIFMIILWSDNYLDSPACLNEMGAAWLAQSDYTNIYVPSFSLGNPKYHKCAVDTNKIGIILNGDSICCQYMLELKNKIQHLFNLNDDQSKTQYLINEFISDIKKE